MDVGLIFGMVIAIMVITLVFIFGFQQVSNIQDLQGSAEMIRAADNLEAAVARVYDEGGESSERIRLSFPATVRKVCFVPMYDFGYYGREPYPEYRLVSGLQDAGLGRDSAVTVAAARIHPGVGGKDMDENLTMLVFFTQTEAPAWYDVPHLAPSEREDGDPFLCVVHGATVWLQRKYDSDGAWVDVEEA